MTEAQIAALKDRDYTVLIDRSGSMGERDAAGGQSRWDDTKERTIAAARRLSELDPDGITVMTFAGSFNRYPN